MKIYYKNKLLFENIPEENVEKTIDDYIASIDKEYDEIFNRVENLIKTIEKIRYREKNETSEQYFAFLEKEHNEVLKELESVGIEFYKENFVKIFFLNSEGGLVGLYVKNNKKFSKQIFLPNVLFDIAMKVPVKQLFEIEE